MASESSGTIIRPCPSYDDGSVSREVAGLLREVPGLADWLGEGDEGRLVVVKPNWVQESHGYRPDVWEPLITHPTVVSAAIVALAEMMRGRGTIAVCDGPNTYADFGAIVARGGFDEECRRIRDQFPGLRLELLDLRREVWIFKEEVIVERRPNPHDPRGYVTADLGRDSFFYGWANEGRYYGADYDTGVVNRHHQGDVHEYLMAGTPMACDLFVNLPKLKTHKKTGITCCLKNLVGINGDKNYLPHHTEGTPRTGGDEYPDERLANILEARVKRLGRKVVMSIPGVGTWSYRKMRNVGKSLLGDSETVVRNGNWSGNDTCWRMTLDLNRALLFGNLDGSWRGPSAAKRYVGIVDGVVGGEGNGPLCPDGVASGVLIAGTNPAEIDAVSCQLMGFDPATLPMVARAFGPHRWPIAAGRLEDVRAFDGRRGAEVALAEIEPAVPGGFRPHFGWKTMARPAVAVTG